MRKDKGGEGWGPMEREEGVQEKREEDGVEALI